MWIFFQEEKRKVTSTASAATADASATNIEVSFSTSFKLNYLETGLLHISFRVLIVCVININFAPYSVSYVYKLLHFVELYV